MKKTIYRHPLLLSVTWAIIIFCLCATPGQYIPSADWLDLLSVDKLIHASMFFILSSLLFIGAIKYNKPGSVFVIIIFACIAYGGLLEIMQAKCFSNRSADWQDFLANSIGCLLAILFLKKLRSFFRMLA